MGKEEGRGGANRLSGGLYLLSPLIAHKRANADPRELGQDPRNSRNLNLIVGKGYQCWHFFFVSCTSRCAACCGTCIISVFFATVDVAHVSLDSNSRNHTHRYDHDKDVLEPEREGQRERSFMSATFATLNRSRSRVRGLVEDPQGPGGSSRAGQSFHPRSPHI